MRISSEQAYRTGVGVAAVTSLLTVWTTVVRDDGNGFGFFMLVMAALVGAFAAWFRPAGMARAMLGVAVMQALLGISIATATVGSPKAVVASTGFTIMWLMSAAFFRLASAREQPAAAAHS